MEYRLALDIGSSSIGWCIFLLLNSIPVKVVAMGVRIFNDGRDPQKKTPLAVGRRIARGASRQRDRKLQRIKSLLKALKESGLMPSGGEAKVVEIKNPYKIRAKAASQEVSLYELGRALFHINRRRGFKSNRKADRRTDEKESSAMKSAINDLRAKLCGRTLGEFLYERVKTKQGARMRAEAIGKKNGYEMYADRSMYEEEFERIWNTQSNFHKKLTPQLRQKLYEIIFTQRPLKVPERGFCQFENSQRREYSAMPISQQFRIYSEVAQLEIISFEGDDRRLTPSEREKIANELLFNSSGFMKKDWTISFDKILKLLNLPKSTRFNLQSDNRKGLSCDKTSLLLSDSGAFGKKWFEFDLAKQSEIVGIILNNDVPALDDKSLESLLREKYSLSEERAQRILELSDKLPDGTVSLSGMAMSKIMPHLKKWNVYSRACALAGYDFNAIYSGEIEEKLPYYAKVLHAAALGADKSADPEKEPEKFYGKIGNPIVHVALNQLRRVVNKLIEIYGKPAEIVVETARDLPMGEKGLAELKSEQAKNKKENDRIAAELEKIGIKNNYENRMKFKIWEDLNKDASKRCCPFCGKPIALNANDGLFSRHFEVEHLLPYSQTFDDSRNNKVIACKSCNNEKANRPPFEAFGHELDKRHPHCYDDILSRAKDFVNAERRLWRFKDDAMQRFRDEENDLIARVLNDTRYMARAAREYLTSIVDSKKVITVKGAITGLLRRKWHLNELLNNADSLLEAAEQKNRNDNRHHAIDAFILCTVSRSMIQRIAQSAKMCEEAGYERIVADIGEPFDDFDYDEMARLLDKMLVSFKPDRGNAARALREGKTLGKLHEESALGAVNYKIGDEKLTLVKRIKIDTLNFSEKNVDEVADDKIRNDLKNIYCDVVLQKGDKNIWAQLLKEYADKNKIRRVRIHIKNNELKKLIPIKDKNGKVYKYYANAENYCMDIYLPSGGKKWQFRPVSIFEAHQKGYVPAWRKTDPHAKLVMRLFKQDVIAYEENGKTVFRRITGLASHGQISLLPLNTNHVEGNPPKIVPSSLQKMNARKVYIDEIGRLFDPGKPKYSE